MTAHYSFVDVRVKLSILSFDFFYLQILEGIFKLTADFFHTVDNCIHIIALFDACFGTLKIIQNL